MREFRAEEFKRGDGATVTGTVRDVQIHHVVRFPGGMVRYVCRSLSGYKADDRVFRPEELNKRIGLVPVLPPA